MASQWTYIPTKVIQEEENKKKASAWAGKQRAALAQNWGLEQQTKANDLLDRHSQAEAWGAKHKSLTEQFFSGLEKNNEWQRENVPGVAGIEDAAGEVQKRVGEANQFLRENDPGYAGGQDALGAIQEGISIPAQVAAENIAGPRMRNEVGPVESIARGALGPLGMSGVDRFARDITEQGIGGAVDASRQRWQATPEPLPGVKGVVEAVVDPLNLVPFNRVQQLAKNLPEAGQMARRLATEQTGALNLGGFTGKGAKDLEAALWGAKAKGASPEEIEAIRVQYMGTEAPTPAGTPVGDIGNGGQPPRTPIWAGKTSAGAPPPPNFGPPTAPAAGFPSGRTPGGPQNMTPSTNPDAYEQLRDALTPTKVPAREQVETLGGKFMRGFYDKTLDLKWLEEATKVPAYKLAAVVNGAVSHGERLVEKNIKPIFNGLGENVKDLEQYMVAMRLQDILARNPHATLPNDINGWPGALEAWNKVKATMNPAVLAKVEDAAKQLWQLNDDLILKPRLEAGLLSKEQYNAIKSANPHYISFYREDFTGLQSGLGKHGNLASVADSGIDPMDIIGSNRKLDKPLTRFEAQVINTQRLVSENRAAKSIVGGLVNMEMLGPKGKVTGAKTPLRTGEKFARIMEPSQTAEQSNIWGTISYMDNGQKVTAQVPKVYADIAKGMEVETANAWSNVARATTAPLRAGAVTYNIAFMPKNIIRDAVSAYYREGLVPLSKDYIAGWRAAISKNTDYDEAAKAGVLMSGIVDTQRSTEALARASRLGAIKVTNAKDALLVVPRLIERFGVISEQATRIGTFKKLRGQGLDELESAVRSRDVSVDFAKSGNVMKLINQVIPFSNAGVQGAANTLRTMKSNPKQALIGSAPLAMASILAYANNQRYETAKDIPSDERAMNWVIMVGEGTKVADPKLPNKPAEKFPIYIKIPKGPLGALLTSPIETGLDAAFAQDDRSVVEHLLEGLGTAARSLSPIEPSLSGITPPLASTAIGVVTGQDTFRDTSIVPRGEQDRAPELQAGPETSRTAVALGERFKVSPRLIEWAIKDYAAGVGGQGLWLTDIALGALGYDPTTFGASKKQELTDQQKAFKLPVVSSFVGTRNTAQDNAGWDKFNNAVTESQRAFASMPDLKEMGITMGPVGASISIKDGVPVTLTPQQRADLQSRTTSDVMTILTPILTDSAKYRTLTRGDKEKVLRLIIEKSRETSRTNYLSAMPKKELAQNIVESYPIALGR